MERAQWPGWVRAKSETLWLPDVTGQASRAPQASGGTKGRAKRLLLVHLRVLGIHSCAERPQHPSVWGLGQFQGFRSKCHPNLGPNSRTSRQFPLVASTVYRQPTPVGTDRLWGPRETCLLISFSFLFLGRRGWNAEPLQDLGLTLAPAWLCGWSAVSQGRRAKARE